MKPVYLVLSILLVLFVSGESAIFRNKNRRLPISLPDEDVGKPLILTSLIENGKIKRAQKLAKVNPSIGNITSYSGYLTTNESCGNNLFFWFFPAQENWEDAPVVLWLQGGPGSASMYGLFEENGPFNSYESGLEMREYSWNVKHNLIYIDQPVGTGYSFTNKKCYPSDMTVVGEELYSAITQFLTLFPVLQENKFFITGESFGGHYIPAIGYTILKKNPNESLKVNLAGLMIGDGWTDPREQINYGDYLYQTGFIDDSQLQEFYFYQDSFVKQVDAEDWEGAYNSWNTVLELVDTYAGISDYNYLPQPDDLSNYDEFLQLAATRRSIHVGSTEYDDASDPVYNHLMLNMPTSVKPWVEEILVQIPILFYVGQVDVICGYPMVRNFLKTLVWSGQDIYMNATRTKWIEDNEIAGYIKGDYNMFDALVRDAGHMVPHDQPFWAYQLVNNFTAGTGFFAGKMSTMN